MRLVLLLATALSFTNIFGQNKNLTGTWNNGKEQIFVFDTGGNALWIFYTENKKDTFRIKYITDFSVKPYKLDLTAFSSGPLKGKTLFGIVEFVDKKTIKFDCEPGPSEDVRPKEFDPKQTQIYKKQK